jgi:1,4-dihydroxy-6-naphthoate synthase
MNEQTLTIALSPCPNDTFIFGSWVLGRIKDIPGHCSRFFWQDIQNLNEAAQQERFDIIKVSAVQALKLKTSYTILACGGAFGLEHGPKLVARPGVSRPRRIAVPGMLTTAVCLLEAALERDFHPVPMTFDQEINALQRGTVDAALLIHETALVYKDYGLDLLLDLGKWWQETSHGLPLPLGVIMVRQAIAARPSCSPEIIENQIRLSLDHARTHRACINPFMRSLAQEMDQSTLDDHIRAYVNAYSRDMGPTGQAALDHLQTLLEH